MAAVPLISIKAQRYGGRLVAAGELFFARTRDEANLLKKLKFAEDAPASPSEPPQVPAQDPEKEQEGYRPVVESPTIIQEDQTRVFSGVDLTPEE